MMDIEYMEYNFNQNDGSDRYRIYNSDGQIVEHGYEKPNMSVSEALTAIQRFMAVRDAVREERT